MKTAFIIPGLGESAENPAYPEITNYFRKKGIRPLIVPIQWKYRTMSDYVAQFEDFYNKNKTEENSLLGFSFGAFIAFVAGTKSKNKSLVICSLSPYFKEDLKGTIKVHGKNVIERHIGSRRIKDFEKYSFNDLTKEIKSESVYIFVGEKELEICKMRAEDASRKISRSRLIKIKDTEHRIGQEGYLLAVKDLIDKEF